MDAAESLRTFASQYPGFQQGVLITFAITGLALIFISLYQFATYGRRQRQGLPTSSILWRGMGGSALLGIGQTLTLSTRSFFEGASPRSVLDYAEPSGSEAAMLATVLVGFVTLIGWIGVGRGWLILSRMGESPGGQRDGDFWSALVMIGAGTIAANLVVFSDIIAASFGWNNYLRSLLEPV